MVEQAAADRRNLGRGIWKSGLHGMFYATPGSFMTIYDRFLDGEKSIDDFGVLGIGLVVLGAIAIIPGTKDYFSRR